MSEIKNKNYILEAIDQLRRRKARPDIQRICNFMTRRFAVDSKDTKADLQRCIDRDIVYKVEYKGNISYRNALKRSYGHTKKLDGHKMDGKMFANVVTTAVAELYFEEPDHLVYGVPAADLIKKILAKYGAKYTRKYLTDLLQREVDEGGLVKMDSGNYSLGPTSQADSDHSEEEAPPRLESPPARVKKKPGPKPGKKKLDAAAKDGNVGVRLGVRRKRAKKVFDPSDNNLPKNRKRGRPLGSLNKSTIEKQSALNARLADTSPSSRPTSRSSNSTPKDSNSGVCSVCHLQGKKGTYDRMISCRECSNKAHHSCLNNEDGMLRMHPDNTWQCPHCKSCVVCFETSDAGTLTVCSICADAYHSGCHEPKITDRSRTAGRWLCSNCQMEPLLSTEIKTEVDKTEEKDGVDPSASDSDSSPGAFKSTAASPTPPTLSPQANRNGTRSSCSTEYKFNMSDSQEFEPDEPFDPTIPDASNWTYDDVYDYFARYFPDEAAVFKEQEIDGHSLLLMKRVDVLTSLNLKLGPALKIYRHVLKLQVRKDDPKLYWL